MKLYNFFIKLLKSFIKFLKFTSIKLCKSSIKLITNVIDKHLRGNLDNIIKTLFFFVCLIIQSVRLIYLFSFACCVVLFYFIYFKREQKKKIARVFKYNLDLFSYKPKRDLFIFIPPKKGLSDFMKGYRVLYDHAGFVADYEKEKKRKRIEKEKQKIKMAKNGLSEFKKLQQIKKETNIRIKQLEIQIKKVTNIKAKVFIKKKIDYIQKMLEIQQNVFSKVLIEISLKNIKDEKLMPDPKVMDNHELFKDKSCLLRWHVIFQEMIKKGTPWERNMTYIRRLFMEYVVPSEFVHDLILCQRIKFFEKHLFYKKFLKKSQKFLKRNLLHLSANKKEEEKMIVDDSKSIKYISLEYMFMNYYINYSIGCFFRNAALRFTYKECFVRVTRAVVSFHVIPLHYNWNNHFFLDIISSCSGFSLFKSELESPFEYYFLVLENPSTFWGEDLFNPIEVVTKDVRILLTTSLMLQSTLDVKLNKINMLNFDKIGAVENVSSLKHLNSQINRAGNCIQFSYL